MDEVPDQPAVRRPLALNMLVGTAAGNTYTESEVRQWMAEAGLSGMTRKDTSFGTTLIVGRKGGTEQPMPIPIRLQPRGSRPWGFPAAEDIRGFTDRRREAERMRGAHARIDHDWLL